MRNINEIRGVRNTNPALATNRTRCPPPRNEARVSAQVCRLGFATLGLGGELRERALELAEAGKKLEALKRTLAKLAAQTNGREP